MCRPRSSWGLYRGALVKCTKVDRNWILRCRRSTSGGVPCGSIWCAHWLGGHLETHARWAPRHRSAGGARHMVWNARRPGAIKDRRQWGTYRALLLGDQVGAHPTGPRAASPDPSLRSAAGSGWHGWNRWRSARRRSGHHVGLTKRAPNNDTCVGCGSVIARRSRFRSPHRRTTDPWPFVPPRHRSPLTVASVQRKVAAPRPRLAVGHGPPGRRQAEP